MYGRRKMSSKLIRLAIARGAKCEIEVRECLVMKKCYRIKEGNERNTYSFSLFCSWLRRAGIESSKVCNWSVYYIDFTFLEAFSSTCPRVKQTLGITFAEVSVGSLLACDQVILRVSESITIMHPDRCDRCTACIRDLGGGDESTALIPTVGR